MQCSRPDRRQTTRTDDRLGGRTGRMVTGAALGLTHRCERWVPSTMTSPRPSGIGVRALRPTVYEVTRHLPFSDSKVSPVATSRFPTPTAHDPPLTRSEEHTSELQSLMRNSYAVFCLKKNKKHDT